MKKIAALLPVAGALMLLAGSVAFAADPSPAMKMLDPDKDGTIDLKEAEAGGAKVFKKINPDNDATVDMKEAKGRISPKDFKAANPDNDGTLDEKEYMALVDAKFKAADPDNDGTVDQKELDSKAGKALLRLIR